ncbi:MAG: hypothetical protein Q7S82_02620 [bacterium]|nr:hypothetical protein [bacterium]
MIKKLLPALVIISFLSVLVVPALALAADAIPTGCTMKKDVGMGTDCPGVGGVCPYTTGACGICCVLNTIYNIMDWIFVLLIAIAGIFVLMGAFQFLTSAGSPEKTKTGRDYILYAAIGLAAAFLSKAIPPIVKYIIS